MISKQARGRSKPQSEKSACCLLFVIGRPNCCWPSPAQSFLVPGPAGPITIFFRLPTQTCVRRISLILLRGQNAGRGGSPTSICARCCSRNAEASPPSGWFSRLRRQKLAEMFENDDTGKKYVEFSEFCQSAGNSSAFCEKKVLSSVLLDSS
jgi:hypothetical protein